MEPNYIHVVQFDNGIKFMYAYRNVMSYSDEFIYERLYKNVIAILLRM